MAKQTSKDDKKARAKGLRRMAAEAENSGNSIHLASVYDSLARSWELDDPTCAALALADAQVWATLHAADVQADALREIYELIEGLAQE